jgi:hypothetical protein
MGKSPAVPSPNLSSPWPISALSAQPHFFPPPMAQLLAAHSAAQRALLLPPLFPQATPARPASPQPILRGPVSQTGAARLILPQTLAVAWHSCPSRRPATGPTCQRERSGSAHHLHYSHVPARRAGSHPRRCMANGAHWCPASSSSTTHDARSTAMSSLPLLPPSHVSPPDALQARLPFLSPTLSSLPLIVLGMALPRRPGAAARKLGAHGAAAGLGQPAWASARGSATCGAARSQPARLALGQCGQSARAPRAPIARSDVSCAAPSPCVHVSPSPPSSIAHGRAQACSARPGMARGSLVARGQQTARLFPSTDEGGPTTRRPCPHVGEHRRCVSIFVSSCRTF